MAIFTPGPAVAQVSGSVGGTTFSHNKGGQYMRRRAVPTTSTTDDALAAKSRLATASQAWEALTTDQKNAWENWAANNPITNALGNLINKSGHQAYVGISCTMQQAGDTPISVPPVASAPDALTTLVLDADIGLGDTDITYTASPQPAGVKLWIEAAVTESSGIKFVENKLRVIKITSAAPTSPEDIEAQVVAKFGTLSVGQQLYVRVTTYDSATGLRSAPLRDDTAVTST